MKPTRKQQLDKHWAKEILEKRGIPILPPDHWIYSEGTSIEFVTHKPSTNDPKKKST